MNNPAGGGLDGRSEFIAQTAIEDSLVTSLARAEAELLVMRDMIIRIVQKVHFTYHSEGVVRPPWELCTRSVCREAQSLLESEG